MNAMYTKMGEGRVRIMGGEKGRKNDEEKGETRRRKWALMRSDRKGEKKIIEKKSQIEKRKRIHIIAARSR